MILAGALGLLLASMGHDYATLEFWTVMVVFIAYGYYRYREGFDEGLEAADDVLELSNRILEQAKAHVSQHTTTLETERKALEDIVNTVKDKQ